MLVSGAQTAVGSLAAEDTTILTAFELIKCHTGNTNRGDTQLLGKLPLNWGQSYEALGEARAAVWRFAPVYGEHPRVHTCLHTDGCSRDALVTWLFPFRHFPPLHRSSRWQLPPLCALNLSKRWRWAQRWTFHKGTQSSPRSCCRGEKKVQECPLTRAPSTRLSSPWWEPLRPWSSAVTSPAPSSDITPDGVTRELTDGQASLTRCVICAAIFLHGVILGTF